MTNIIINTNFWNIYLCNIIYDFNIYCDKLYFAPYYFVKK